MDLSDETFLHAFQKQVARTPERIALSDATQAAITYGQAQRYANYVSRKLREAGVGPGDIVGIFLGRTAFFPVAAIGVFQTGAAYMPIDPRYPDSRIAFMLEDSAAKVLITSRNLAAHTAGYTGTVLYAGDLMVAEDRTPEPIITGNDMDYLIYTSGTTGNPKGAMNLHKGLMNLCEFYAEALGISEHDSSGVFSSFGFDASVVQIFPPLTRGAKVVIIPNELMLDMPALNRYAISQNITILPLPASITKFFDKACEQTTVKTVVALGDRLTYGPGKNFLLYNMYGPTEASVFITSFSVDKAYNNYPIGTFIKNNVGYIVDEDMKQVPAGEAGELWIAGIHIGTGYLKRPELTAEKFIKNPFSDDPDYQTLYKTGDLCRVLPDGNYEFLGRIDTQVKIRGFRVELGEIEMTLRNYAEVNEAICQVFEDKGQGEKYIVGYYTGERVLDEEALQRYLSGTLPFYMVPSVFVKVDAIPLNANGKYDRKALQEPARKKNRKAGAGGMVSSTETAEEQVLAVCLQEMLGGETLDFGKNFSEAGGDSLGAIELMTLLIEKNYTVQIGDIINPEHTLRDIARLLVPRVASITRIPSGVWEKPAAWSNEDFNRVVARYGRENIERLYDLTLYQRLFLNFYLEHPGIYPFHLQLSYRVEGPLDMDRCCTAFALTARRHPMLQTAIVYRDVPCPMQLILANRGVEIIVALDEPLEVVVDREFRRGFDFEKDHLFRVILRKEETAFTHIIVSSHHVISDGWSLDVLMRDFTKTYRALAKNTPVMVLKKEMEKARRDNVSFEEFVNYINTLDHEKAVSYFLKKLEAYTTKADLVHDYPNPQGKWNCAKEFMPIPKHLVEGVRSVAQQCQVSPAAVYEGVFALALQQECGSSDVIFSSLSNERWYPVRGIADIVGCFMNRVSARITTTPDTTFAELFTLVQKQITEDLQYSYVNYEQVEKHCKYLVLFSYLQSSARLGLADDVSLMLDMEYHTANEDIFLTVEATDAPRLRMEYNPYNYSLPRIERFLRSYLSDLEYVISHTEAKLSQAPVAP
ncbi:MAG: amino acid adenylation domain-containing protein [Spirochaetaceae bacterium]|nr:amino acid adenylation domain-containing protein [Spirochaetaceae bacterium]